jgi:hypothetical protein
MARSFARAGSGRAAARELDALAITGRPMLTIRSVSIERAVVA